mgnify:CR=1 FL=1
MFASLHNHCYSSNIRFLDSINRPEEMVEKAISLGYSGIAFTDHESLSAAIAVLKIRDKVSVKYPDFKFVFGNEIYLIDESEVKNTNKYYHFVLLAKDQTGWDQLRILSSRAWERGYTEKGIMRVPTTYQDIEEVIKANPGHIFASTACLGGRLPTCILDHNVAEANNFVRWCMDVFGADNFALELQPSDSEEQIAVNKVLVKLADHYDLPYIVTTDSHYLNKEDFAIHSAFLNSKQSKDRETDKFYKFTYMMSEVEMHDLLSLSGLTEEQINNCFNNTINIINKIENFDFRHSTIVPEIKVPDFTLSKELYHRGYEKIDLFYDSAIDQDRYLIYQIEQGIHNKGVEIDAVKLDRINTELDVLDYISKNINQNLSAYLNLTVNIVDIAWNVSLVGCGRGSACGFYINYLIGITQADPLVYDLPHWRFLNKERAELPDVDEDFQPEKTGDIIELLRQEYGEDNVLNCATFKTESLKSAILTSMRGLGYNNDDAQALAALVPAHRGKNYSLNDCLYGNEEEGFEPVPGFREKLDVYPGLFDAVQKIEGLPTNSSIHASALYIFNNGYIDHNSLMRAPNKTKMTAFNMHDSDDQGALKMDVLRTDAQSKMAKCLDLLLKDKQIEWQGSLRSTYNKYLHPDVLDYNNPEMWRRAADGEITNLFQFDTEVGSVCIKKARPTNVMQLAEINSIMRLQVEGSEQPIDRYVRFRDDINVWYLEMIEEGLTMEEMDILKKYLNGSFGISGSQEKLMLLVMDPKIAGFTLGEANGFRKAIAKKIPAKIQENKEKYFSKGAALGTREPFLNYVWKYCVEPQLGYAFSLNHTLPYSVIAVQEMNLATRWNPLYWQCACLCINSGNYATDLVEEDEDPSENEETEEIVEVEEEEKKEKHVAPNYGKIAKAISDAQLAGVKIELPDINTSQIDFVPDVENNSILFSLLAINVVNSDLADRIIEGRPYSSMKDFRDRIKPTDTQMIGLVKAGCFDNLEHKSRTAIMANLLQTMADEEFPLKDKVTAANLKKALKLGLQLDEYTDEIRMYKFKQYIDHYQKEDKRYVLTEEDCLRFFRMKVADKMNLSNGEYSYIPEGIAVKITSFEKVYKAYVSRLLTYLNSEEGRKSFQKLEQDDYINAIRDKYCQGNTSTWEMDTMCFYHGDHELKYMNNIPYNTKNFHDLEENPVDKKLCTLAGTVTDSNNSRHMISLLTNYGVVDIKIYSGTYVQFNQKVSVIDEATKKKTIIDDSWFKKGTKLIVHGQRRENLFQCKNDRSSGYTRSIGIIDKINLDGSLVVRYNKRRKVEED